MWGEGAGKESVAHAGHEAWVGEEVNRDGK